MPVTRKGWILQPGVAPRTPGKFVVTPIFYPKGLYSIAQGREALRAHPGKIVRCFVITSNGWIPQPKIASHCKRSLGRSTGDWHLPRRGWIPQPRVAQRTLGNRIPGGSYPEG